MLRVLFPIMSLVVAGFSIWMDMNPHAPDSGICLRGGCRIDQTDASILSQGATPSVAEALLAEDPADPGMWCAYGEYFAAAGQSEKAVAAFDRALQLGPGLSPVLVRVANFDFSHDRQAEGLRLIPRILLQTDAFDELLYSYVRASAVPLPQLLGTVIPVNMRVAASWLNWEQRTASDHDVLDTWAWMRQHRLDSETAATQTVAVLWQRKNFIAAEDLWSDYTGTTQARRTQFLSNIRFESDPKRTPLDWDLSGGDSVRYDRGGGLTVRFAGRDNLNFTGMQQRTVVAPGRYRFAAVISAEGITTDEGPYFRIADGENGHVLSESMPITGTVAKTQISLDFTVPPGTRIISVGLARRPSIKFDSKLAGALHIDSVSLTK